MTKLPPAQIILGVGSRTLILFSLGRQRKCDVTHMGDHRCKRRSGQLQWYQSLFGQPETPPGHDDFGQILDTDGTVLLCLHQWGAHDHPSLMRPDHGTPGNGLLLFFRVDDFDLALQRARALITRFEEEPHVNRTPKRGSSHSAIRTDTMSRLVRSLRPGEGGLRGGGLTSACSRRRRAAESGSHGSSVRAFAAEALIVRLQSVAS